jgi:hypothetical protein
MFTKKLYRHSSNIEILQNDFAIRHDKDAYWKKYFKRLMKKKELIHYRKLIDRKLPLQLETFFQEYWHSI